MTEFGLIIPTLSGLPRTALAATPRLRALLQRSRPLPMIRPGLQAVMHAASGAPVALEELAAGPVSALGDGLVVTGQCALAEPLALQVHTDHVTLAGLPQPQVSVLEADALVAALNDLLGEDGLRCERVSGTRWYLHGAGMAALAGGLCPVAGLAGIRLDEAMDAAPEARRLRALLTEVQMLFYQHPVNEQREAQGLARIDGLWLSGGGAAPARIEGGAMVFSHEPFARGLMQLAGYPPGEQPQCFETAMQMCSAATGNAARAVWVDLAPGVPALPASAEASALLERDWLRPAWRALARGEIAALCWRDHQGRGGRLTRPDRLRVWARRLP